MLCYGAGLAKVGSELRGTLGKYYSIMVPSFRLRSAMNVRQKLYYSLLCGASKMTAPRCDNFKNLALSFEPPGSPTRPTLRDGH
jgi:hypothetical protein